jgi:sensor histidine kinase regulating citrate/malate metabolism
MFKKSAIREDLAIMNMLWKNKQEQYEMSRENIALINQKCHDLKHQIRALRNADKEELDRYLGEIEESVGIYEAIVKTGNDVFDTILTEKSLYCKNHDIQVNCVADGSQLGFIDTIDLYAILGNVMDNAIEASMQIKDPEMREISVKIGPSDSFMVFRFQNRYETQPRQKDSRFLTSKSDASSHGFGLESIKGIAEKYGGSCNAQAQDHVFILTVLIPARG